MKQLKRQENWLYLGGAALGVLAAFGHSLGIHSDVLTGIEQAVPQLVNLGVSLGLLGAGAYVHVRRGEQRGRDVSRALRGDATSNSTEGGDGD